MILLNVYVYLYSYAPDNRQLMSAFLCETSVWLFLFPGEIQQILFEKTSATVLTEGPQYWIAE